MAVLRVLHVTPYAPDAWAYGGIPRVVAALTQGLARRGHDVTLCTTDACDQVSRLPKPAAAAPIISVARQEKCTLNGPTVRMFPNLSNGLAYHFQAFLPVGFDRFMRQHASRFDVAHLHACRNLPGVIAARHLRRHRIPYVLAPNGTAPIIERRRALKRLFDRLTGARLVAEAARLLAVTQAEARDLAALDVPDDAIDVIPNPVDLAEFELPADGERFRRRFAAHGPLVLFLGKITPRKGLDVLARAFALLAPRMEATLVVAGNDMGGGAAARDQLAAAGLSSRVRFTGLLARRDRLEALAAADVVVYPSSREVFGLVPLEALLSGTPVIVSGDSGCGEVIGRTGGGQVVPFGDAAALADAIACTLQSLPAWREAASRAAAVVRATYSADVVCEQIEHMYLDVLKTPRPATVGSGLSRRRTAERGAGVPA